MMAYRFAFYINFSILCAIAWHMGHEAIVIGLIVLWLMVLLDNDI